MFPEMVSSLLLLFCRFDFTYFVKCEEILLQDGGAVNVLLRGLRPGCYALLYGVFYGWCRRCGLESGVERIMCATGLGREGAGAERGERKCLDWSNLFANFVVTSCIRQYGLGGIGGVDLCRPDISFLWWEGILLRMVRRGFIMFVLMVRLWTGCLGMILIL